jgi:hypothetical protein
MDRLMRWLQGRWYARLRKIDLKILWPACLENAYNTDQAQAAFAMHAFNDPAWLFLGEDEIRRQIDALGDQP